MKQEPGIDERLAPIVRDVFAEMIQRSPSGPNDSTREALMLRSSDPNGNAGSSRILAMAAAAITVVGLFGIAMLREGEQEPSHGESGATPGVMLDQAARDTLSPWRDGVRLIVYMSPGAPQASRETVHDRIDQSVDVDAASGINYLGPRESLTQARRILAEDKISLEQLDIASIPTAFYVTPLDSVTHAELAAVASALEVLPDVLRVDVDPQGRDLIPGVHAG